MGNRQTGVNRLKTDKLIKIETKWKHYLPGITRTENGFLICAVLPGKDSFLVLHEKQKSEEAEGNESVRKIAFLESERIGNVWIMELSGTDFSGIEYCFESDGVLFSDIYGTAFLDREIWGGEDGAKEPLFSLFPRTEFDWENDRKPMTPYEDSVFYQLHTRGFTKHTSSKVKQKGTFGGILEKIEYLKTLGVTALELLPVNEFSEVMMSEEGSRGPGKSRVPTGVLNYWGYAPGYYLAVKAAYASGGADCASAEFKTLVKEFHKNGIELIIQLFFTGREEPSLVRDIIRFWVREYHVDGIHLIGFTDAAVLAGDPYLADTKLLSGGWDVDEESKTRRLGEYNDGFLTDMRCILKGDEERLNQLIFRTGRNPKGYGVINYMAETNGFTMMDMVTYEQKHNEANGEHNRDGSDYNYTWNCGVEGPVRRKKVVEMRKQQLRNAFLLLFLSQGTPLIMAGDEFGATKGGNNNAYCQDNEISWLNWNLLNTHRELYEFVRYTIAFRKRHPVFHRPDEPRVMDYLSCGLPDVSYHGVKAWCPEFDNFRRQLGILYCGEYCTKTSGERDDYFFVAYNMHWEPHEFSLPKLPKELLWHMSFNTAEGKKNGIYEEGHELVLENQKQFMVPARSIVVFAGLGKL